MSDRMTCPDESTLERLLAGLVPDEAAVDMEEHLLRCGRCCEQVRELLAAGSKENVASARAATELSEDPAVIQVAERVATLRLPDHGTETLVADADTTEDAWEVNQILDPPASGGEIGRFGGYRVLRLLGAGGMGLVWEAEDTQLCRPVALKVMKPALANRREHRERFLREARAAAALDHSHIVTVYQVGEYRGLPFLAMQLLRGETLDDALRRQGRLPQGECLRVGRQMAEALGVAHRRGLIHRDIKPGNTWLEADGWVKLVDFGLAQVMTDESHLTQTGVIIGTPAFMSPEQARGDTVDPRSDLFSLGAVLYRMATGVGAFAGSSTLAVLTSLALRVPDPPHQLNPEISPEFSGLIMSLMAKDPAQRPASADDVVDAIRDIEAIPSHKVVATLRGGEAIAADDRLSPSPGVGTTFRPPQWLKAAASAAAVLILATIIIVIRNRGGEKVGELHLSGGQTADIVDTDTPGDRRAPKIAPTLRGEEGPAAETNRRSARSPSAERTAGPSVVPNPPSLDEWLKGRTILGVSQDGNAQFKTIQAALDAVQPGQAVEVLDRGPYRETLLVFDLKDTGLVSRTGTVIEPAGKRRTCFEGDTADFHFFTGADRFRLSGFSFLADDLREVGRFTAWISFAISGEMLVEGCHFAGGRPWLQELGIWWDGRGPAAPLHIRECLFDMGPVITTFDRSARSVAIIERNWFRTNPQGTSLLIDGPAERVLIRHNVFDGKQREALRLDKTDGIGRLEICNNVITSRILARENLSARGVIVRNNLLGEGIVMDDDGSKAGLEAAVTGWQVGNNEYAEMPLRTDQFPLAESDFVGEPEFLSQNSTDSGYLRVAPDSDEARRGTGGKWPTYLGALPPGPAPATGDWLTRLVERNSAKVASQSAGDALAPSDVPDPPPLEEWLKGRKTLTVSQDGRGDFKTIQEALDAMKPGQAVEVLDQGPYHETFVAADPQDAGFFSRVGTIIAPGGNRRKQWDTDTANSNFFSGIEGFRLHGFNFVADDLKDLAPDTSWLSFAMAGDLLIESCRFSGGRDTVAEVLVYWYAHAAPSATCHVRECLFETAANINVTDVGQRPRAVIERNWFRPRLHYTSLSLHGNGEQVVVRQNVFDGGQPTSMSLLEMERVGRLEIYNNTFGGRILAHDALPAAGVVMRNNLFGEAMLAGSEAAIASFPAAAKGWQIGNNEYAQAPERANQFPKAETDSVARPNFFSRVPTDRDYLRIGVESRQARRGTGGAWPSYLGALPPGPAPADGDWLIRLQKPR